MTEKELVTDTEIKSDPVELPISHEDDSLEDMIPKSRAELLIKKAKLKGKEQMQSELDALKAENENLKSKAGTMGGMAAGVSVEEVEQRVMANLRQQFQENAEARAQEELQKQAEQISNSYKTKMQAGKASYDDFDEVTADFKPENFPNLVWLVDKMDNAHDIMYELMSNPNKLATVVVMSERDPHAALNMLTKISSSIKTNQAAKAQEKDVQPPLGRLTSSSQTTGQDTGELSMRDMKRMFKG